jgi:hypothetical protein
MRRKVWMGQPAGLGLVMLGLAALMFGGWRPAQAATGVTFTVAVESAYLRAAPAAAATPTYSVFKGQMYAVTGRTADGSWVTLDYAGGSNGTWIRASFGAIDGSLSSVAVRADAPASQATPAPSSGGPAPTPIPSGPVSVVGPVVMQLTITANSTYVRDAPSWDSNRVASLFQGSRVGVIARDAASQWLFVRLHPVPGWVPAGVGQLDGNVLSVPVAGGGGTGAGGAAATPSGPSGPAAGLPALNYPVTGATPEGPLPAWIPTITTRMRTLYQRGLAQGRDPRMFTIAGDCNSEGPYYLELVAVNHIDTRDRPYLNTVIQQFRPSFFHQSQAVYGSANTTLVMNPLFTNPQLCQPGETPFECELRRSRASIMFIMLGTGDHTQWQNFEANYRRLIETTLRAGALPVLMTKPDALETLEGGAPPNYINDVIRRLGREYEAPVLDFWLAAQQMENGGLLDEPGNDFHYSAEAMGVHVIATLQVLYRLWTGW